MTIGTVGDASTPLGDASIQMGDACRRQWGTRATPCRCGALGARACVGKCGCGGGCWAWAWPGECGTAGAGARVCEMRGRVSDPCALWSRVHVFVGTRCDRCTLVGGWDGAVRARRVCVSVRMGKEPCAWVCQGVQVGVGNCVVPGAHARVSGVIGGSGDPGCGR